MEGLAWLGLGLGPDPCSRREWRLMAGPGHQWNLYDGTGHGVTGADVEQDLQGAAAEGDPCGHREETGFIDDGQDNACNGARDEGLDEAYQYVERHYPDAE